MLFCNVIGVAILVKYRHQIVDIIDIAYREYNRELRNAHCERMNELNTLVDNPNDWYCLHKIVAHGGGGIDNKTCTNSYESIQLHYDNGTRMFDIDMIFTSDSVLVCRHGWNDNLEQTNFTASQTRFFQWDIEQQRYNLPRSTWKNLDYKSFIETKPHRKYTPISVVDFLNFMETHDDVWLLCDFGHIASEKYNYFYKKILSNYSDDVCSRIVVTFNEFSDLTKLRLINPDIKLQLKRYGMTTENYYEVAKFCIQNEIHAINLSVYNIDDKCIRLFRQHGIHVFMAVVDYLSDYDYCLKQGASGIVSNFLFEDDLKLKRNGF